MVLTGEIYEDNDMKSKAMRSKKVRSVLYSGSYMPKTGQHFVWLTDKQQRRLDNINEARGSIVNLAKDLANAVSKLARLEKGVK